MTNTLAAITPYLPFITVACIATTLALIVVVFLLHRRITKLLGGTKKDSLEQSVRAVFETNEKIQAEHKRLIADLQDLDARLQNAVSGVGLVKFNPFAGSGDSKPSFALALISEKGDGVIVSNLHARDSVTFFTKEVHQFKPSAEVSEEEAEALEKAKKSLHNK